MNKKDIAYVRKQFKTDNEHLQIEDIFNVYVQKESGDIYHHESQPFDLMELEAQELFFVNFKKVLTGQLETKLFELRFQQQVGSSTQTMLYEALHTEEKDAWQAAMLTLVEKMYETQEYEFDTVVTFIRGTYRIPTKQRDKMIDEGGNETEYANPFILCSLNKTSQPKRSLVFDYIEKEFKPSTDVDPIIQLTSPLTGFMFPTFSEHAADVNRILYSAGKANQPDELFVEEVLQCEDIVTAVEDKDTFELIVSKVSGESVNAEIISSMYEQIEEIVQDSEDNEEEEESPSIDYRDVEGILTTSGVEDVSTEKVKEAFQTVIDDEHHTFKAKSLIPKTVKINTEVATISLHPKDLKNIKYVTYNGKKCLLLEINEDVEIEGFQLTSLPFQSNS